MDLGAAKAGEVLGVLSPVGLRRGWLSFVRYPIHGFRNQRGRANVACLDASSDALSKLANGHIRVKSKSVIRVGVSIALM